MFRSIPRRRAEPISRDTLQNGKVCARRGPFRLADSTGWPSLGRRVTRESRPQRANSERGATVSVPSVSKLRPPGEAPCHGSNHRHLCIASSVGPFMLCIRSRRFPLAACLSLADARELASLLCMGPRHLRVVMCSGLRYLDGKITGIYLDVKILVIKIFLTRRLCAMKSRDSAKKSSAVYGGGDREAVEGAAPRDERRPRPLPRGRRPGHRTPPTTSTARSRPGRARCPMSRSGAPTC